MAYTLEVDHPDFPDDQEFDLDGILVKNKSKRELTDEDEIAFISRQGRPIKEVYGHGTLAKLTGSSGLTTKAEKEQVKALLGEDGGDK